mgnify:CR=1 FL=1
MPEMWIINIAAIFAFLIITFIAGALAGRKYPPKSADEYITAGEH